MGRLQKGRSNQAGLGDRMPYEVPFGSFKLPYSILAGKLKRSVEHAASKKLDNGLMKKTLNDLDHADSDTCASLLQWCSNAEALVEGKRVHAHIIKCGLGQNHFLESLAVHMYSRCGAHENAMGIFCKMHCKNVALWNSMIRAHARQGLCKEALQLFCQMQHEGIAPNKITYLALFDAFAGQAALVNGERTHARLVNRVSALDVVMGTNLINMYGKCGNVKNASEIFYSMPEHDVVAWTAIIAVFAHNDQGMKAVESFYQMQGENMMPNKVTYVSILDACASSALLFQGKQMHAIVLDTHFGVDVVVQTALLNMYAKCGSLEHACAVFEKMPQRDRVAWNAMIAVYAGHGQGQKALQLFGQMQQEQVTLDKFTCVSYLTACANDGVLSEDELIHNCILASSYPTDVFVGNALINMYGKCGNLQEARKVFDKMPERNVVSWTVMIASYAQHRHGKEARCLFDKMLQDGVSPNKVTFLSILTTCARHAALAEGKQLHAVISDSGFELDVVVGTALINMYHKCGSLEDARMLFDKMPERDAGLWNAMIAVYAQNGLSKRALQLFHQMQLDGIMPDRITFIAILYDATLREGEHTYVHVVEKGFESDVIVGTALISMYGKCGSLRDAQMVYEKMPEWHVASRNAMISVYSLHRQVDEALKLYYQMQQMGVMPDRITFVNILDACTSQVVLIDGERVHAHIKDNGLELDEVVGTALVTMYGKCGSLNRAKKMFDTLLKRNTVSWNALIAVYAQHGQGEDVLRLFDSMQREGITPDEVTFVSVLGACSHAGLVDQGRCYFLCMEQDYGILPTTEHYACMVDLLGRAGHLDEVDVLVKEMPIQPTAVSFFSFLGACRYQTDVERGACAARHGFELDSANAASHVILSNIFVEAG